MGINRWALNAAAIAALAACTAKRDRERDAPQPDPAAAPARVAAPAPPPAPAPGWEDSPLTEGSWSYAGGEARFVSAGGAPLLTLRCDAAGRRILLVRQGSGGGRMVVRTTTGARTLSGAGLPAADPLLDAMVFSRGRFAVEAEGQPPLILPAWAEPARVVEDCRA